MANRYRPLNRNQRFLLPPDMTEWLADDHLVWFVLIVTGELDTSALHARRRRSRSGSGRAAYNPDMLLGLLIYAYAHGIRSSRQIERSCHVDVAFRILCAQDVPDHTTISRFVADHDGAVAALFAQVLVLCARNGLGQLGVVAVDGTKLAANAAKDANRTESWLREQAAKIVDEAKAADEAEDALFGSARGDELPDQLVDPRRRSARIRQCLDELDAEQAAAEQAAKEVRDAHLAKVAAGRCTGRPPRGVDPVAVAEARLARERARQQAKLDADAAARDAARREGTPQRSGPPPTQVEDYVRVREALAELEHARAQAAAAATAAAAAPADEARRNITDPDSRLMPSRQGFVQGYNGQAVTTEDQIVIATAITQDTNDVDQLVPMMDLAQAAAATMTGSDGEPGTIGLLLADAGYLSEANLTAPGPDRLIAVGKRRDLEREADGSPTSGAPPAGASPRDQMDHRLRTPEGRAAYRRRGCTIEPVFGHVKDVTGLRRFRRRGKSAAASEFAFAAMVLNLLKLHRVVASAAAA